LLFEKGFDNVYLLSGGLEQFLETHYEFVEGAKVPEPVKPKVSKTKPSTGLSKKSTITTQMGRTQASLAGKK
jgi:centrosomal protein CEP41